MPPNKTALQRPRNVDHMWQAISTHVRAPIYSAVASTSKSVRVPQSRKKEATVEALTREPASAGGYPNRIE